MSIDGPRGPFMRSEKLEACWVYYMYVQLLDVTHISIQDKETAVSYCA